MTETIHIWTLELISFIDRLKKLFLALSATMITNIVIIITNTTWHYADILVCLLDLFICISLTYGAVKAHKLNKTLRGKLYETNTEPNTD